MDSRNLTLLLPIMKNARRMKKLTSWLRDVAMAAPAVPRPRVKMKTGSRMMLSTPPVVMPTMAKAALPSLLRRLFITNEAHMNGQPRKMYCA